MQGSSRLVGEGWVSISNGPNKMVKYFTATCLGFFTILCPQDNQESTDRDVVEGKRYEIVAIFGENSDEDEDYILKRTENDSEHIDVEDEDEQMSEEVTNDSPANHSAQRHVEDEDEQMSEEVTNDSPANHSAQRRNPASWRGKNRQRWSSVPAREGRPRQHNIALHLPGPKLEAPNVKTYEEAWSLILSEEILDIVTLHSNEESHTI
ncbi:hypothetical protein QE152_g25246 [Popillia japonica]|uniref:Uncharacterized protein n=1 Tax=Popillia japonica TaxID=7064 RepID=A0AAW1K2A7_POPJA